MSIIFFLLGAEDSDEDEEFDEFDDEVDVIYIYSFCQNKRTPRSELSYPYVLLVS